MHRAEVIDLESVSHTIRVQLKDICTGSYALLLHLPHLATQAIDVTILFTSLGLQRVVFEQELLKFMRRIKIRLLRLDRGRRCELKWHGTAMDGIDPRQEQTVMEVPSG